MGAVEQFTHTPLRKENTRGCVSLHKYLHLCVKSHQIYISANTDLCDQETHPPIDYRELCLVETHLNELCLFVMYQMNKLW